MDFASMNLSAAVATLGLPVVVTIAVRGVEAFGAKRASERGRAVVNELARSAKNDTTPASRDSSGEAPFTPPGSAPGV